MINRDAQIRYWPIIGEPLPISTKKLSLLSYLSYLFRLRLLSEDAYLQEKLQSADKNKNVPQSKVTKHPLLPEAETTLIVRLLLVIKIKTCTF